MEVLFWLYGIGVGVFLGIGFCLLFIGGIFGIEPKDSTILKYVGFSITWPISYPVWTMWVVYKDK
jgi:hypothetical protein